MRSRFLTVAATLAGLWASVAWAASDEVPSGGTEFTLAPSGAVSTPPGGIFDPAFRPGNLSPMFLDPPATTIPFRFASDGVTIVGVAAQAMPPPPLFTLDAGAQGLSLRDVLVSVALAPGYDFNFAAGRDLAALGTFGGSASAFGDPLMSALQSPYLSATDGGVYAGLTVHLADDLQLRIGHAVLGTQAAAQEGLLAHPSLNALPPELALRLAGAHSADMTAVGLDWNFADWGALGLTASHSADDRSLLGDVTPAAIAIANRTETAALGISARVGFGGGWVTKIAYNQGVAQLDLRPKGFAPDAETVPTRSYGITFAKQDLFGGDVLGLTLSQTSGNAGLLAGTGVDGAGNLAVDARSLLGGAPESDIELGYITSFLGGSLALQANAAYQVNAGGQKGQNAVSVVSRAKINF